MIIQFLISYRTNFPLNTNFIENIYVADDGRLHKVQGGADSVINFSQCGFREYTGNSNTPESYLDYPSGSKTQKSAITVREKGKYSVSLLSRGATTSSSFYSAIYKNNELVTGTETAGKYYSLLSSAIIDCEVGDTIGFSQVGNISTGSGINHFICFKIN